VARRGQRSPGGRVRKRAVLGVSLVLAGIALLVPVERGVTVSQDVIDPEGSSPVPVHVYIPADAPASPGSGVPGVVVAHGFAGSARLMHSWSLALAHAGFTVVTPDLPGHGGSSVPLRGPDSLSTAIDAAVTHLLALPDVDAERIALLGHSMGSGAVLARGISRPDAFRAVVAVSPTDAAVDEDVPRALLLIAGANEARFVANAESLLERAGGVRGEPGAPDGRRLDIIPRVEHVSILFSRTAQEASVDWIASALGHVPSGRAPIGPLAGWTAFAVGLLVLWQTLAAPMTTPSEGPKRRRGAWAALLAGGVAATASLVIVVRSVDVPALFGMLVAGEVGLWFLMVGAVWLRFGVRPAPPDVRDAGWLLLATAVLVLLGGSAGLAWAPWWLPTVRLGPALLLMICMLPFSIAAATMLHGRRGRAALGAWAGSAAVVAVTLGATALVVPGLGFLLLVLPLLPVILAVTSVIAVGVDRPWATGVAGAVFIGWLLAMLFPLA